MTDSQPPGLGEQLTLYTRRRAILSDLPFDSERRCRRLSVGYSVCTAQLHLNALNRRPAAQQAAGAPGAARAPAAGSTGARSKSERRGRGAGLAGLGRWKWTAAGVGVGDRCGLD